MIEIDVLKARINELERENTYLKDILTKAGIEYEFVPASTNSSLEVFDMNQGARILPEKITRNHARLFFSYFWGRMDVYSKRSQNKTTGKVGYYPQCDNFWHRGICPKASGNDV